MKKCTHCNIIKPLSYFYNKQSSKDGKASHCIECDKNKTAIYRNNFERREKARKATANWVSKNKERKAQTDKLYKQYNRHKCNYWESVRYTAKIQRTVKWANQDKIQDFYKEAKRLTEQTGIKHHVDHIIPLQGKLVSGLHVENNLQVIPAFENLSKSNKFDPNKTVTGEPYVHNNSN